MISVRRLICDERKYCTHCDDDALYVLNFCNSKVVQQSSSGVLCKKCMALLKAAVAKATVPNSSMLQLLERLEAISTIIGGISVPSREELDCAVEELDAVIRIITSLNIGGVT